MSDRKPQYNLYIDWFGHGGLVHGFNNWLYHPELLTSIELSTEQVLRAGESIKVTGPCVDYPVRHYIKTVADVETVFSVWIYIPTGNDDVIVAISENPVLADIDTEIVTARDTWHLVTFSYTTTDSEDYCVRIHQNTGVYYIGWMETRTALDDNTCYMASTRKVPDIVYGRDSGRDLEEISPGDMDFVLINSEENGYRFTPGNPTSPIAAGINKANRQVVVTAEFQSAEHILYVGYMDDLSINAAKNDQTADISLTDELGRLAEVEIATDLFPSVRTGDAIREIKEQAGLYPSTPTIWLEEMEPYTVFDPYVENGATTLRWWSYVGDALTALRQVQEAEGPPSIYSVGTSGQIIYRDRVHRLRANYPEDAAVTLTTCGDVDADFVMQDDSRPDYGWRKVLNRITAKYRQTQVSGEYSTVWKQPGDVTWGDATTLGDEPREFTGTVEGGYYDAQDLVQGELQYIINIGTDDDDILSGILPEDHDYVLVSGTVLQENVKRSGTQVYIRLAEDTAGAGSTSTIRDLSLKARAIESESLEVIATDDVSIRENAGTHDHSVDMSTATRPDAESVSQRILTKRSFPRPVVTAVLKNMNAAHMAMLLTLDIGTPVHILAPEWFIDEDFAIEGMRISLGQEGNDHEVTLYLEQINPSEESSFTFDELGYGFDDGIWGSNVLNASNAFILGSSSLDGPDLLAY